MITFVGRNGGDFLVGCRQGRRDIMRQQERVGVDVTQADGVQMAQIPRFIVLWKRFNGQEFPDIVGVGVGVRGDLLSLAADAIIIVSERIFVRVRVQIIGRSAIQQRNIRTIIHG